MAHPVVFFEVVGRDRSALQDFYGQAFGWTMNEVPGPMPYTTIEPAAENGIAGGVGADPSGGDGHVTFYVDTDDIEASLAKIEELGGKGTMGPVDIPYGRIAHFTDPEGHTVGLWSGKAPEG
jgi:predicted enzyme related to lactoylglutathione lyase